MLNAPWRVSTVANFPTRFLSANVVFQGLDSSAAASLALVCGDGWWMSKEGQRCVSNPVNTSSCTPIALFFGRGRPKKCRQYAGYLEHLSRGNGRLQRLHEN